MMSFRQGFRRLRLQRGDILMVKQGTFTLSWLQSLRAEIDFKVPIVFVENKSDVARLPFDKLEFIYLEAKKAHETKNSVS